jgi:hypothetical protein
MLILLAAPVLLGGAALAGLASGGLIERGISAANATREGAKQWTSWAVLVAVVLMAVATLAALLVTIPRVALHCSPWRRRPPFSSSGS